RFYGDRWCKLDLTTVTENHGGEKRLTRLRLDIKPTLFRNALLLLLSYLLVLSYSWSRTALFVFLPMMVFMGWQLGSSRRRLRRTVMASILATAEGLGMTMVGQEARPSSRETPREEPVTAARRAV